MAHQLPIADWPIGLDNDAAFIRLLPREIAERGGIHFTSSQDNLGLFEGAVVRFSDGSTVALQSHESSPVAGTKLVVGERGARALASFYRHIGVRTDDILWQADAFAFPPARRDTILKTGARDRRLARRPLLVRHLSGRGRQRALRRA